MGHGARGRGGNRRPRGATDRTAPPGLRLSHTLSHIFFAIPRNSAGRPRLTPDWSGLAVRPLYDRSATAIRCSGRRSPATGSDRCGHSRHAPDSICGTYWLGAAANEEKSGERTPQPVTVQTTTAVPKDYRDGRPISKLAFALPPMCREVRITPAKSPPIRALLFGTCRRIGRPSEAARRARPRSVQP